MRLTNAATFVVSLMLAGLLAGCGFASDSHESEGGDGFMSENVEGQLAGNPFVGELSARMVGGRWDQVLAVGDRVSSD